MRLVYRYHTSDEAKLANKSVVVPSGKALPHLKAGLSALTRQSRPLIDALSLVPRKAHLHSAHHLMHSMALDHLQQQRIRLVEQQQQIRLEVQHYPRIV
jgi:hypothetical protein